MKKLTVYIFLSLLFLSCSQQRYAVTGIEAQRIPVITNNNLPVNMEVRHVVNSYKNILEKEMGEVIGYSDLSMSADRPESLLTNLTSDVMFDYADSILSGDCDISLMNVHGHRAGLAKGDITVGNVYEIYSFENALILLKIKGCDLMNVFKSYAVLGGAGISSTVKLQIKNGELLEAKVKNKEVDPEKIYTVVTLDYLADGNDGMEALKNAVESKPMGITLRDVMLKYIKKETGRGTHITSELDNRIVVVK